MLDNDEILSEEEIARQFAELQSKNRDGFLLVVQRTAIDFDAVTNLKVPLSPTMPIWKIVEEFLECPRYGSTKEINKFFSGAKEDSNPRFKAIYDLSHAFPLAKVGLDKLSEEVIGNVAREYNACSCHVWTIKSFLGPFLGVDQKPALPKLPIAHQSYLKNTMPKSVRS